jgi:hypothetical protein
VFVLPVGLSFAAQDLPVSPVSGIYGNSGLWKVLSTETVAVRRASVSTWYDRARRNPGGLTIGTFGAGAAVGITNRLEGAVQMELNRRVTVGSPEQLSFGQQALGLFGNRAPGSPPLPSELMPGSSRVPQLRAPPNPAGMLTGTAGYYNLLPFAGLVRSAGAAGLITLSAMYRLFSETLTRPFGLAVHSYLGVPIHKAIDFLMTHPVGTADLHFGVDAIAGRNIGESAEILVNAGFRHISQPAHASVFRLADELPLGIGLVAPRRGRLQFMMESVAEVFVGGHTPNATSGPADPAEMTAGFRLRIERRLSVTAGYQRPVRGGSGQNGFAVILSYAPPS